MKVARPIRLVVGIALLHATPAAQVPDGYCVVSTLESLAPAAAPGGLFLVDPRVPGAPIPVTGLGTDLTGLGLGVSGANCVTIRQDDGVLLVGEVAAGGTAIDLHEIVLSGASVVSDTTTFIGTARGFIGGGIQQIAILPDGNALIGVGGLVAGPPMNGALIGIVDRVSGAVTPIPLPPALGAYLNALTVDRTGTTAYAFLSPSETSASGTVVAIPLAAPASATPVAPLLGASALAVDGGGQVLASVAFPSPAIESIDPATGIITPVASVPMNPNGMALEAATDLPVYVLNTVSSGPGVYWVDAAGTSILLTAGITGAGSGIDVRANPRTYGAGTPGLATYGWQTAPNPGGLPQVGNAAFSITVTSTSGSAAGVAFASFAPASFPLLGTTALIDPVGSFFVGAVPPGGTVPVPIRNDATLIGVTTYFQSFHLDAGAPFGLAASPGLLATILG